jgi:hypothetical protein
VHRYRLYAHVVDTSGATDVLTQAIRVDRRGRRPLCPPRTFLILGLLAAASGKLTVERMHAIATRELPREVQWELGILRRTGEAVATMPVSGLYYLTKTITARLDATSTRATKWTAEQRQQRTQWLQEIVDRLITATLPDRPGSSYALDETAIWAWAKGRKRAADAPADQHHDAEREQGDDVAPQPGARAVSVCPDARWGSKTGKDGSPHPYFGYAMHALVRVPDLRPGPTTSDEDDPALIEAIAVTPASTDVVDVSLALLDRVRARHPVRDLAADRHYSYKEWNRWARELWARGIHPVLDLRSDEHGFRDYNSARIAASWPHCPATPDRLGTLPRPAANAGAASKAAFAERISERFSYAMRRVSSHIPDGRTRWECPARAGKLGCPIVEGSVQVARELELPVVANPPAEAEREACCTQRTFMIRVEPPHDGDSAHAADAKRRLAQAMKHSQDEYWGDRRWIASWNRRTYVEGAFGNLKNPDTENTRRGYFRFTGLPLVTLAMAFGVTVSNVRQLRNWHERTGNGDTGHPLLQAEPEFHGYTLLTAHEADAVDDRFGPPRAA